MAAACRWKIGNLDGYLEPLCGEIYVFFSQHLDTFNTEEASVSRADGLFGRVLRLIGEYLLRPEHDYEGMYGKGASELHWKKNGLGNQLNLHSESYVTDR